MSGKTSYGKKVALILDWNFLDTDIQVENAYVLTSENKYTCREIVINHGEQLFRDMEQEQINTLSNTQKSIIAIGGGSLNNPSNIKTLQQLGCLVYLRANIDKLWEKTKICGIPAYLNQENPKKAFYEMAEKRISLFESVADFIIDTDQLTEQEIINAIAAIFTTMTNENKRENFEMKF